jgi:outer membrane protein OmpA-like peptidoglycan-associated protein
MSNHPSAKLPTAPPPAEPSKRLRKNLAVYFESGKFDLLDIQKEQIAELINQFEDKKNMKIKVTGFADDVGDREFNLNLSERRASFVAEYIQGLGVPKEQISFDGKGIAEGNLARHQKRKVEIIILN